MIAHLVRLPNPRRRIAPWDAGGVTSLGARARAISRDTRIRFLAVGSTNTVIGYAVFAALQLIVFRDLPFGYLVSLVLSYAVGIAVAFVLYRRFVWKVSGNVLVDLLRFIGVYLTAIAINAALLPLLVELVGLPPLLAQLIVLVITTLVSFFGHSRFSFARPPGRD